MRYKKAHVLGIPDNYRFNAPALIELLEQKVQPYLLMEARVLIKQLIFIDKMLSLKDKAERFFIFVVFIDCFF
ncbi:hypothetical protein I6L78_17995 [Proteus vulgaris]|jgi:hypothetical protein|uniref:hypothetical protein n=1 Tax=Proteus TaxID=583 RepID=UPI000B63B927|nr:MULTISPECIES: hypothetical protein [Proteus]MBW3473973.1 hypothetical protein [Proteus vulgaris]MCH4254435.1 hypothetical protein [Proteus vulgaris]MDM3563309.1 hypothetical protein [Proteus vulgaris]